MKQLPSGRLDAGRPSSAGRPHRLHRTLATAAVTIAAAVPVAAAAWMTRPGQAQDRPVPVMDAHAGTAAAGLEQDAPALAPMTFPLLARGARLRSPAATPPRTAPPPTPSPTPDLATATPTPTPTAASPTATAGPATPGVPTCDKTRGDAGGFRFSLDDGASLAPNARPLAPLAYTWDVDVDPRDPDVVLELHQGALYESRDAGCTFSLAARPGDWDQLIRAPSQPDLLVAASVFRSALSYSEDGGHSWATEEALPTDVFGLAIAPDDPWHWTFVGRDGVLYERPNRATRWTAFPIPGLSGQSVTAAAAAPSQPGRWLVGTGGAGLFRTDDNGRTWRPVDAELRGEVGTPPDPVTALVVAWVTVSPTDADVAFVVVNRVGRQNSQRGIWRSADGGESWSLRVEDDQGVADRVAVITGGTRVFVSPRDPDHVIFPYGLSFQGYGTDLFRSHDGLATLAVSHFDGFYEVFALEFGPPESNVLLLGVSSDIPSW